VPDQLPVCGWQFDQRRCRQRGEHLCWPRVRHVLAFFTEALVHTKGDYAGKPFVPAKWQREKILTPLFGRVVWDQERRRYVRRYRILYLSVARKNGKTELLAGIMLYLLVADGEIGAEIYGLALDMAQAGLVYRVARQMVRRNRALRERLKIVEGSERIVDERTGSFYGVIASDAGGTLGLNPSGGYIDELLTQRNRDLFDALRTGMGARSQPLLCLATTAEASESSFAATERQWSERIDKEPNLEPERLVVIFTADPEHDWRLPATWREANPALGDFLEMRTLASECNSAQGNPVEERSFRQYRLNQPGRSVGLAINMPSWDTSAGPVEWRELAELLEGERCFGGMDLSATSDLAAYALVFPLPQDEGGGFRVLWRHFVPASSLLELGRRSGGAASVWVGQGALQVTEGNVTDYGVVKRALEADRERYEIVELGFNKWQALQLSGELAEDGWPMMAVSQGFGSQAGPTSELLRMVGTGRLHHGGNPVARWQASNAVTRVDMEGNLRFDKTRSIERIEGLVAAVMGVDRAIRHDPATVRNYAAAGFS
jgi:phage terminase large subunit-like protein